MHRIQTSIRRIAAADLPKVHDLADGSERPAAADELLNLGIQHIADDLYSCIAQEERDPDTLTWSPKDQQLPGTVVTEGNLRERHDRLPLDVRPRILRAAVIRSTIEGVTAREVAMSNLAELEEVLSDVVGPVEGRPLIDTASPEAQLAEAQRLVGVPDNGIERQTVAMIEVDAGDVVEADGLIPHSWAGEPKR